MAGTSSAAADTWDLPQGDPPALREILQGDPHPLGEILQGDPLALGGILQGVEPCVHVAVALACWVVGGIPLGLAWGLADLETLMPACRGGEMSE